MSQDSLDFSHTHTKKPKQVRGTTLIHMMKTKGDKQQERKQKKQDERKDNKQQGNKTRR